MSDSQRPAPSDLATRTAVGSALIGAALIALWAGGLLFWLVCVTVALFMMAEWADLERVPQTTKRIALFALVVPLAIMAPIAAGPDFFALGLIAGAWFFTAIITRRTTLAWGIVYVAVPVLAILLLRGEEKGVVIALWVLGLVWATDIGAYFAGRTIGGPRLAPRISPNKTWAGLVGGVILATLFGALLHGFAGLPFRLAVTTPLLAVASQLGDLFESWLKRRAGVKDSGTILPGHGGFLDRLDGLVAAAPLAAMLIVAPRLLA